MQPLARKLSSLAALADEEQQALLGSLSPPERTAQGHDIVSDGDEPSTSAVLLEGVAARYKLLPDGRRQILSFHVPGDMVDLHAFVMKRMDHGIIALTPCQVSRVPHTALRQLVARYPELGLAMWRDTMVDSAIFREWEVNLGQRPAVERIAHLLCELAHRLEAAGLCGKSRCHFPLTQAMLADAVGMSVVHVNRTLQELRGRGLITLSGKTLTIHDWTGLTQVAGFDASYLTVPAPAASRTNGRVGAEA